MFSKKWRGAQGFVLSLPLLVGACTGAVGDAPDEATESSVEPLTDAAAATTGTGFVVGGIKDSNGAAVPGVAVNISGAASRVSNANSNGVYRFSNLAAGTYTVTPVKAGATFSPTSATFTIGTNELERAFVCTAGCDGIASVSPLKELMIVDPSVTGSALASNAADGHFSFRFLMEQMAPAGTDPADFVLNWLQGFKSTAGPINGFAVDNRNIDGGLVAIWPKRSDGKLDLAQAPFKLLAIVNRTDLHEQGDGEGRFIFGMTSGGIGQSFTVIFEYRLPTTDAVTSAAILRKDWITQFHALGGTAFGSAFNAKLQAITDQFTMANKVPSKPNGSAISQVRTNEIQFGSPWQLREFHLVKNGAGVGFLALAPAAQTPDPTLNNSNGVASYITGNRAHIIGGLASVTKTLLGGQSNEAVPWSFSSFPAVDEEARHSFAGQTCNGCHNGESAQNPRTSQIDGFYHVSPRVAAGPDGTGNVSDFIKNAEFPRRTRFMQNRLVCKADFSDCSPGAEPML